MGGRLKASELCFRSPGFRCASNVEGGLESRSKKSEVEPLGGLQAYRKKDAGG